MGLGDNPYIAEYKGTGDVALCGEHQMALPDHQGHEHSGRRRLPIGQGTLAHDVGLPDRRARKMPTQAAGRQAVEGHRLQVRVHLVGSNDARVESVQRCHGGRSSEKAA